MRKKQFHFKDLLGLLLALTLSFWFGAPAHSQSSSAQASKPVQVTDARQMELAQFDQFLDSHHEIAEQLRKDPSLVNNKGFVDKHPTLQSFMQEHPGVHEEVSEDPGAVMKQLSGSARRDGGRDGDTTSKELAQFDGFMDGHREIAEQLRKNPSLVNNKDFVQKHPALQTYLQDHQGVREEIGQNPNAFMRQEDRFDHQGDARDSSATRRDNDSAQPDKDNFARRDNDNGRRDNDVTRRDNDGTQRDKDNFARRDNDNGRRDNDATRRDNDNAQRDKDGFTRQDNDNGRRDNDVTRRDNDNAQRDKDNFARRDNDNGRGDNDVTRRDNDSAQRDKDSFTRHDNDNGRRDNDVTRRDNDNAQRDKDSFARRDNDNGRRDNDAMRRDNDSAPRDKDNFARRDNDTTRKEPARFDQFADSHREIAEQLRKDPSLVNNREFVEKHPALQAYLQDHPGVSAEMKQNPNAFTQRENQFDHHEGASDNNTAHGHMASFGEFLGGHSDVARQVSKDPSLVKNDDYVKSHPDLQAFVNAHPGMREEMKQNPQGFVKSAQQFNTNNNGAAAKTTPAPTGDATKPKQ
jgi:hypothetical protein